MDHVNESYAEPEGGMTKITVTNDRHCLHEIKPDAGRKCFIADMRFARQCGYGKNERV